MPLKGTRDQKVAATMREFKSGELHSGQNGPVVTNPQQALAIAMSEAGMARKRR